MKKLNHYEQIKNFTIEEMAQWLCKRETCCEFCEYWERNDCKVNNPFIEWLKSEVKQ